LILEKLALFRTIARRPVLPAHPGRNWLCLYNGPAAEIGFACTTGPRDGFPRPLVPQAPSRLFPPGIGFVSHDCPSRERRSPGRHKGRNWVCLYKTPCPPGLDPPGPAGQIGFVSHTSSSAGRREGVPPQVCPQSAIHNPKSAIGKLASFCTIRIGPEWWNDRILEWSDIPTPELGLFIQPPTGY